MSAYKIYLIGGADDETAEVVTSSEEEGFCHIEFRFRDRKLKASASDFFEAFCKIRLDLETDRFFPFCYGASLNVYPSGMCRDMGAGMKAYRLYQGKPSKLEALVGIFDSGPDVIPASVANQKEFYDEWVKSEKT